MSTDFGNTSHPKARKAHRCEWCGEDIKVGEMHVKHVGIWDGDWQSWRMHGECYESTCNDDLAEGFTPYEHDRGCSLP